MLILDFLRVVFNCSNLFKKSIILLLIGINLTISFFSRANDSTSIHLLIKRLASLQVQKDGVFHKGAFPSYRKYALNPNLEKADENAFFTGLIVFTLNNLKNELCVTDKQLADSIIQNAIPYFSNFKNRKERNTYNFWFTNPPQIFPNSGWMNQFNNSQSLPDDMDDTVILLMAMNATDSIALDTHQLMQHYSNSSIKTIHNTNKEYRKFPAYSTWFGNKMPIDFDISVLSNILYFVQRYHLKWTAADSASLNLIEKTINKKDIITNASFISPHYNRTAVILYHLSRLMSIKKIPSLELYKNELIQITRKQFERTNVFMDKVILSTALMRWGYKENQLELVSTNTLFELVNDERFVFFIANMSSMLPNPLKSITGSLKIGMFNYFCESYNICLLLENVIWHNRNIKIQETQ